MSMAESTSSIFTELEPLERLRSGECLSGGRVLSVVRSSDAASYLLIFFKKGLEKETHNQATKNCFFVR